jgi:hypothetical protein
MYVLILLNLRLKLLLRNIQLLLQLLSLLILLLRPAAKQAPPTTCLRLSFFLLLFTLQLFNSFHQTCVIYLRFVELLCRHFMG